jgi:transposase
MRCPWPVVAAAFTSHARAVLPAHPEPVQVLGIDEIRRGRPRWIPDEVTGVWQTAVDRWHVTWAPRRPLISLSPHL